jgi:hypothetical protein
MSPRKLLAFVLSLSLPMLATTARADALRPSFNMTAVGHLDPSQFVDPSDGTDPVEVWGDGNFAYVATHGGIYVIDISSPAQPQLAGKYLLASLDVQVWNGLLFALGGGGIVILDARNPPQLRLLSTLIPSGGGGCHTAFFYQEVWLGHSVQNAYCMHPANNTQVFNLTTFDPDHPPATVAPWYVMNHQDHDATVLNNTFYGGGGTIETVFQRGLLSASGTGGHSNWPTADGRFLVVTKETSGTGLLGTANLVELIRNADGTITPQARATYHIDGGTPIWPALNGFVSEYGSAHNPVVTAANYAYVSFYEAGVKVLKIYPNGTWALAASFDTSTFDEPGECTPACSSLRGAWGVSATLGSNRILVADQETGFWILRHFTLEQIALVAGGGL